MSELAEEVTRAVLRVTARGGDNLALFEAVRDALVSVPQYEMVGWASQATLDACLWPEYGPNTPIAVYAAPARQGDA